MKRHFSKNIIISLAVLSVISFFQNCTYTQKTQKLNSNLQAKKLNGLKCPIYHNPNCRDTESEEIVENEHGCKYKVCISNGKLKKCPKQSTPLCKAHEKTILKTDSNSCPLKQCAFKTQNLPSNFKILKLPQDRLNKIKCPAKDTKKNCAKDFESVLFVNKSLCLERKCQKEKPFSCSMVESIKCRKTETAFTDFDEKGCAKIICKDSLKLKCPGRLNVKCKKNESIQIGVDHKGCKKSLCVKKLLVTKKECELSTPPRCKPWQSLKAVVSPNNCTNLKCF